MNVKQVYTILLTLLLLVLFHSSIPAIPAAGTDLKIVSYNLSGKLNRAEKTELSVTFSHDMIALGQERDGRDILKISPNTEGEFRWKGTRTLAFTPEKPWRWSTTYKVTVPKGFKALNGEILKHSKSWTFQTPLAYPSRINIERSGAYSYIKGYKGDSPPEPSNTNVYYERWWINESLNLRFEQPVDPALLIRYLEVKPAGTYAVIKMKAEHHLGDTVKLTPVKPLLRNTIYRIRIKKGFKGKEGNTGTPEHFSFYVATEPPFYCTSPARGTVSIDRPQIQHYFSNPLEENPNKKIRVFKIDEKPEGPPPIPLKSVNISHEQSSLEIGINDPLQEGDVLLVQLDKDLKNLWGEALTKNLEFIYTICSSQNPEIQFKLEGNNARLKAYSFRQMEYRVIRLNRGIEKHLSRYPKWGILMEDNGKPSFVDKVVTRRREFEGRGPHGISLNPDVEGFPHGFWGVLVTRATPINYCYDPYIYTFWEKNYRNPGFVVVHRRDIDIAARISRNDSLLWVYRRDNGQPVPGAIVTATLNGKTAELGTTNQQGLLYLKKVGRLSQGARLEAVNPANKDDMAFMDISLPGRDDDKTLDSYVSTRVFTDRDYYKPGETVYIGGVVKTWKDGKITAPEPDPSTNKPYPLELVVQDMDDNVVVRENLTPGRFGGFFYAFITEEKFKKGHYKIQVYRKGSYAGGTGIKLDYFQPNTIETAISGSKSQYTADEVFEPVVSGRYLSGNPMAEEQMEYRLTPVEAWHGRVSSLLKLQKNNLSEYTFLLHNDFQGQVDEIRAKVKFNSQGVYKLHLPLSRFKKLNYIAKLNFQATAVTEEGKEASTFAEAVYFPGDRVTGIKLDYYYKIEEPVPLDLALLDRTGAPVTGKTGISLYKRFATKDTGTPRWRKVQEFKDVEIDRRLRFPVTIRDHGFYLLRCDTPDEKGRVISTSKTFYCFGWNWSRSNSLTVSTEKETYREGETIKLFIDAPQKGRALITLEADRILDSFIIPLTPATIFDIPVKTSYAPGIRINVSAWLEGNTSAKTSMQVEIQSNRKQLKVLLNAPKELKPNSAGKVKVKVTGNDGRPVEAGLIIYAVNEGHLAISDYRTPDLYSYFYDFSLFSGYRWTDYNTLFSSIHEKWFFRLPMLDIKLGSSGIFGRVTRKDGTPMSGVKVTVISKSKQHVYSTRGSAQGYYYIPVPLPARSLLFFNADGFQSLYYKDGRELDGYEAGDAQSRLKEINMIMLTNEEAREMEDFRGPLLGDGFSFGFEDGIEGGVEGGVVGGVIVNGQAPAVDVRKTAVASMVTKEITLRQDFRPLLFFKKLQTDKKGEAIVDFKTSELLSTFRIMAVVYSGDSFGSGSCRLLVSKDLLMEETMPEFAREGDSFDAGVMVSNRKKKEAKVKVKAEAEGLTLSGDTLQRLNIPAKANRPVNFTFNAPKEGDASVRFQARSNRGRPRDSDGLLKKLPVLHSRILETLLDFDAGETIRKQVMVSPDASRQTLRLKLAPSILKPAGMVSRKLVFYPYDCLEQRASRIMPFLVLDQAFIDKLELDIDRNQVKQTIIEYIDELPDYMNNSGGLSYYKDRRFASDYLTAYVLWLLKLAQRKRYEVPPWLTEEMESYLRSKDLKFADETQCFLQYVLSLNKFADLKVLKRLFEKREELSPAGICFLLRAMNNQKRDLVKSEVLLEILNRRLRVEADFAYFEAVKRGGWGYWYMPFYSNRYVTAMILQAFLEVKGGHPLAPRIMNWLLSGEPHCWNTTQTNFWILYAMNQYLETVEKTGAKTAHLQFMDTTRQINFTSYDNTLKIDKPLDKATIARAQPIHINAKADGIVYLTTRLDLELENAPAKSRGITVTQNVYNSSGKPVSSFNKGEIYQVELLLDSEKDVPFAVIDAAVPAGFEVMRRDFATTRNLEEFNFGNREDYRQLWSWPQHEVDRAIYYTYSMYRRSRLVYYVKALYRGEFTWPSTVASGMYHPQYYGRTATTKIKIR